jgi:hypothetical protein
MSARDLYALELYANGYSLLRARRAAGLGLNWAHRHTALTEAIGSALGRRWGGLPVAPAAFLALYCGVVATLAVLIR